MKTQKKPTPSPEQIIVLCHMNLNSPPRICRLPGGFWTTHFTPLSPSGVPTWSTTIQTIRAMEKNGWLKRANVHSDKLLDDWRDERELTEAGINFLSTSRAG